MGQGTSALTHIRTNQPEDAILAQLKQLGTALSVNDRDAEDKTALHWAAAEGKAKVAGVLVDLGLAVDAVDVNGDTALHTAAFKNQPEVVTILIQKGANLNLQDSSLMTALHWAVSSNSKECIRLLVEAGCDLTLKNDRDHTPIDTARTLKRRFRDEVVDLIEMSRRAAVKSGKAVNPAPQIHAGTSAESAATNGLAQAQAPLSTRQYQRLASVCKLWGLVKHTHPSLAYKSETNWDKALLAILPKIADPSTTDADYRHAVTDLLYKLIDPNTRAIYPTQMPALPQQHSQTSPPSSVKKASGGAKKAGTKKKKAANQIEQPILDKDDTALTQGQKTPSPPPTEGKTNRQPPASPQASPKSSPPSSPTSSPKTESPKVETPATPESPVQATKAEQTLPPPPPAASAHAHGRSQPYVELTREKVAVVVASNYEHFVANPNDKLAQFVSTFASASAGAAIIFDVRCAKDSPVGARNLSVLFQEAFKLFLQADLPLPTFRQRVYTGLPEHRRSQMQVCKHGFYTEEAEVLSAANPPALPSPATPSSTPNPTRLPAKTMCFLVDKNTPMELLHIALGIRSAGQGQVVYQVEEGDYRLIRGDNPGTGSSSEMITYEPHITASVFSFPDDDIKVLVRQHQRVNPDGSVGFNIDEIVVRPKIERASGSAMKHASVTASVVLGQPDLVLEGDAAVKAALKLLQGRSPTPRPAQASAYAAKVAEEEYAQLGDFPALPYRYLAIFRLWNAVYYFHAYKDLIDDWDTALTETLPKIETATNSLEYSIAISHMVHRLHDTHASVRSAVLTDWLGSHVAPLKIGIVEGKTIVTHLLHASLESATAASTNNVLVGDQLLTVDGISIDNKRKALEQLFSAGTKQAMNWRVDLKLLAGPKDSQCQLRLLRKVKTKKDPADANSVELEQVQELEVQVRRSMASLANFSRSGPLYSVLEKKDKFGNGIGFIDLTRLTIPQIDEAIEAVLDCTTILLDIRGHTRGTLYRLGPLFSTVADDVVTTTQMSYLTPSMLSDDLASSSVRTPQRAIPLSPYDATLANKLKVKKLVALVSEDTISQGEYTVAYLQTVRPDIVLIGRTTSGTLGNPTNVQVPGRILISFTGVAIITKSAHNQAKIVQGKGIEPNVVVAESLAAVAQGQDAILDAAVAHFAPNSTS